MYTVIDCLVNGRSIFRVPKYVVGLLLVRGAGQCYLSFLESAPSALAPSAEARTPCLHHRYRDHNSAGMQGARTIQYLQQGLKVGAGVQWEGCNFRSSPIYRARVHLFRSEQRCTDEGEA